MSFGRYLLRQGALTQVELNEYAHIMVVFGGRLGTILVEAGRYSMDEVEDHLAAYLSMPRVPLDRLEPDPEALATVSPDLAERHAALPLFIDKRVLHVAMLDPADPYDIEQLSFASGHPINGYVIAERRLMALLEQYYNIRQDPRFTDGRVLAIVGHADSPESLPMAEGVVPTRSSAWVEHGAQDEAEQALGIRNIDARGEVAEAFSWLDPQRTPTPPAEMEPTLDSEPAPRRPSLDLDPADVAHLEGELALLKDRDALAGLLLEISRCFVRRAALFLVRDETIQGVAAAGRVATPNLRGLDFPALSDHLLARAAREGTRWREAPASTGDDARLLAALGSALPPEAAALPIRVAGRVVNLLYVDNESEPLAEASLAALDSLCTTAAVTYERMILEMKRLHR